MAGRPTCPECGSDDFHWHSKSEWCMACGYGRNFDPDPATGRPVIHHGSVWEYQRRSGRRA